MVPRFWFGGRRTSPAQKFRKRAKTAMMMIRKTGIFVAMLRLHNPGQVIDVWRPVKRDVWVGW